MKYAQLATLALTLSLAACAHKPGKLVEPAQGKPVAVTPKVKDITKPLDTATTQNAEARTRAGQLSQDLSEARKSLAGYDTQLIRLIDQGKAEKLELITLHESLKNLQENSDQAFYKATYLEKLLGEQNVSLAATKGRLGDALVQAATSDEAARNTAADLTNAVAHAKAADAYNDKMLVALAKSEQRTSTYGKYLAILAFICLIYVGLRLAKLNPSIRPFLFWIP